MLNKKNWIRRDDWFACFLSFFLINEWLQHDSTVDLFVKIFLETESPYTQVYGNIQHFESTHTQNHIWHENFLMKTNIHVFCPFLCYTSSIYNYVPRFSCLIMLIWFGLFSTRFQPIHTVLVLISPNKLSERKEHPNPATTTFDANCRKIRGEHAVEGKHWFVGMQNDIKLSIDWGGGLILNRRLSEELY